MQCVHSHRVCGLPPTTDGVDYPSKDALGYWEWQAEHLAEAWCLHLHPINAIFYSRPSPYGRLSFLGKGFVLRCFQDLS